MAFDGRLPDSVADLKVLGLIDFISLDTRPTFIVEKSVSRGRKVIYANSTCLDEQPFVREQLGADDCSQSAIWQDPEGSAWCRWTLSASNGDSFQFGVILWHATALHDRWWIYTGTHVRNNISTPRFTTPRKKNEFDAALEIGCISPEHHKLLTDVDWGATSLGPIDDWPPELRHAVPLILLNPEPSCLMWGPDRVLLYNESYPTLIKQLHPMALGKSAKVSFASWWAPYEALHEEVQRTGRTIRHRNTSVILRRSGDYLEEGFFTYSFIPIKNSNGNFLGIFNLATEVTAQVLSQCRMTNLLKTGEACCSVGPLNEFWKRLLASFDVEDSEVPFAAIYSRDIRLHANDLDDNARSAGDDTLFLEGCTGFHQGLIDLPATVNLSGSSGLALAMRESIEAPVPFVVTAKDVCNDQLEALRGDELTPEDSRLLVCPLQISSKNAVAWMILGVPKLRSYDADYGDFINLIKRQIETGASSLVLLAEERKGLQLSVELAKMEQQQLTKELEVQKREAEETAWRFYEFAKHSPVGVYILGPEGEVLYANDAYYHLVSITRSGGVQVWRDNLHPDDVSKVDEVWQALASGGTGHQHFEFRVRKDPSVETLRDEDCRFISSTCFAELNPNGSLRSATGLIVDHTSHKALEREVAERLANALEAKRTQENFMDMVSHEMRNPLNAIIQCAEEATQLLQNSTIDGSKALSREHASASLDAVNTILYCGHHQKQIIDDVLTISKLDSKLLTLATTATKPAIVANQALQIYDSTIRASNIEASVVVQDLDGGQKRIMVDAGRILQILINLVGNAVKFLKDRPVRKLKVTVKVSRQAPRPSEVTFVPSGSRRRAYVNPPGVEPQQARYVFYSIEDTGPGLTQEEKNDLFGRFKQASPRTHATYGGSGLGLFISRELAELHGGEIGLSSTPDQGSTFAFYVQGYIPSQPDSESAATSRNGSDGCSLANLAPSGQSTLARVEPILSSDEQKDHAPEICVLIVEDNKINQNVLVRQLKRAGFGTVTADNGEEAIARICESRWSATDGDTAQRPGMSVVLCDLEMPVMDGLTCVKKVRELQRKEVLEYVPMVAVTGNARHEQVQNARDAGFDEVVCKPYSIAKLVPLIKEMSLGGKVGR
ncbi:Hybrid signal transduction histidine kinase K [Sphaceloma murrayae]|uniref:histidine kinase n=1 Tax=Sphaceloma murrayae TaxID=2082308 RepID=A0A2K1QSY5_9PEZI|nr:Hybrid signal transduction histidine kinase K [Sphaceloma murrayae]